MSAPDNRVTACCYYGGETDRWIERPETMVEYWNSPLMQGLRKLQTDANPPAGHGCETCHLFVNRPDGTADTYDFATMPADLSPRQEANWRLARSEYLAGATILESLPARVYGNFGFACNISCTMCHQVPRRQENRNTIPADRWLSWDLSAAQEVNIIGGEPFVLPEAIKFMRGFVKEQRYESVRMALTTNGTILHKHWPTLYSKHRLTVYISLDGIGESLEGVRLGANWGDIERNILRLIEARQRDRPEWRLKTSSLIQKSTIANLPDFARWHAKHGIAAQFSDFISAPGVEDTFHRENFLHNPHLLLDVPDWRDHFDEALGIFAAAGMSAEGRELAFFKGRVEQAVSASSEVTEGYRRRRMRNDWTRQECGEIIEHSTFMDDRQGSRAFTQTRLGDYAATAYIGAQGGSFRVRLSYPQIERGKEIARHAHTLVQDQYGIEIPAFREVLEFGIGTDHILTGSLPEGVEAFRVVFSPVGEEVSLLPKVLEVDLTPDTLRYEWPRVGVPVVEKLAGLMSRMRRMIGA